MSLRVFCLFYKNKQNVSRSKTGLVEFSIRFHGISFESHEIASTDKVLLQCHFECRLKRMYREVVWTCRVLDTISWDFFRIPWNHSNWQNDICHFECFVCFAKASEMYREVRRILSSSRYNFMGFLSNPMKSLELTRPQTYKLSSMSFNLSSSSFMALAYRPSHIFKSWVASVSIWYWMPGKIQEA